MKGPQPLFLAFT